MIELNPRVIEISIKGIKHIQDNVYKFNNTLYTLKDSKKINVRTYVYTFAEYSNPYVIVKCIGGKNPTSPLRYDGFNRCKVQIEKEYQKELISIQNEYWYEVGRKVRRAEELKARKKVKCPVCGKKFVPMYGRKYCSEECLYKASNERLKAEHPVKTYTKICPICGKEFTTHTDAQSYCSASCRIKRNNDILNEKQKAPRTTKACEHCGKLFVGTPREHYCSAKCRIQHNSDRRRTITLNSIK